MCYCWDFEKFADMEKKFLVRNKREITLNLAFIKDILINFEKMSAPQKSSNIETIMKRYLHVLVVVPMIGE